MNTIYFDMDGTIADFYGVKGWLKFLENENTFPYDTARPLVDSDKFVTLLKVLQNRGYKIGIISWTAKNSGKSYNLSVRKSKINWLNKNFPEITFDEIHIVKYGTRKDYVAKDKYGIIFDDDERVRNKWRGLPINPNTTDIIEKLRELKEMTD